VGKKQLTEQERKAAITFLKSPDLLKRTGQAIAKSGLVGQSGLCPMTGWKKRNWGSFMKAMKSRTNISP